MSRMTERAESEDGEISDSPSAAYGNAGASAARLPRNPSPAKKGAMGVAEFFPDSQVGSASDRNGQPRRTFSISPTKPPRDLPPKPAVGGVAVGTSSHEKRGPPLRDDRRPGPSHQQAGRYDDRDPYRVDHRTPPRRMRSRSPPRRHDSGSDRSRRYDEGYTHRGYGYDPDRDFAADSRFMDDRPPYHPGDRPGPHHDERRRPDDLYRPRSRSRESQSRLQHRDDYDDRGRYHNNQSRWSNGDSYRGDADYHRSGGRDDGRHWVEDRRERDSGSSRYHEGTGRYGRDYRDDRRHRESTPPTAHKFHPKMSRPEDGELTDEAQSPPHAVSPVQPPGAIASLPPNPYKPVTIKNRPTRPASFSVSVDDMHTAPLAPASPSGTPPPPPEDRPPTPPSPPEGPPSLPFTPAGPSQPVHRALQATKSMASVDHSYHPSSSPIIDPPSSEAALPPKPPAPDRNALNPSTRVSTPVARVAAQGAPARKTFTRWTRAQDLERLHKEFFGTTTLENYDLGTKVGEGTFGVVTKATEKVTRQLVALKKLITHNPRDGVSVTTIREIKILKSLNHVNVVPIRDMVVERDRPNDRSERGQVFMVFPFMDHDLCGLLSNPEFKLTPSLAKLLFKQILEGMAYIHANNFLHRDIKTANILVDRRGAVMIADFGLARTWTAASEMPPHKANEYTNMVVTRWYRAPELLLGDIHYGPAVDMWSLGCVLGELYFRAPILAGESDRDQLYKIFSRCGPLTQETFPGWDALPGFPDARGHPWDKVMADTPLLELAQKWHMDRGGADLMMSLLKYDPSKRLSANDALDHPWFWIAPKPATLSDNLIKVDSSHEMTVRQRDEVSRPVQQGQQRIDQANRMPHNQGGHRGYPPPPSGQLQHGQMGRGGPAQPMPMRLNPYAPQAGPSNGHMQQQPPPRQAFADRGQQPYGQPPGADMRHQFHGQPRNAYNGHAGGHGTTGQNGTGGGYGPGPMNGMPNGQGQRQPPMGGPPMPAHVPAAPFILGGNSTGAVPPPPFALRASNAEGPSSRGFPSRPPAQGYGHRPPPPQNGLPPPPHQGRDYAYDHGPSGTKRPYPAGSLPDRPGGDKRPRGADVYHSAQLPYGDS